MSNFPKHILIIRLSAMGDVAMTVPVVRELTKQYPEVKITILTRAFFTPFFRGIKNVAIYEAEVKGKHKGVFGLHRLSKELRELNIDAIADLHNVLRSNILKFFLSDIKVVQVNKGRREKKALIKGKQFKQLKTTHERYADVFRSLGFSLDLSQPQFPKKPSLTPQLSNLIGNTDNLIGIAPFAAFSSKAYPLELIKEVISELSKEYKVLLFGGGKEEVAKLNTVESKFNSVVNLAGKLTLDEELDVISNLSVMISMDSGNGHIAAILGVKVISLWGVTHPYAGFYPFNQKQSNALLADRERFHKIPTSIYGNKYPEGYEKAIASITPKEIVEKVNEAINYKD
jgi:ADP-heptose:LPS heptosyltransferase